MSAILILLLGLLAASPAGVKVTDFGAVPDDDGDDAPAFMAAVAAAKGGEVFLPRGRYICNGVTITNDVILRGEAGAILTRTQAVHILMLNGVGAKVAIQGLTFDGAQLEKTAISAGDLAEFTCTNCIVRNCGTPGFSNGHKEPTDGILLARVGKATISGSRFLSCERDGVLGWPVKDMRVTASFAGDCGRAGFASDQMDGKIGPSRAVFLNNVVTNCGAIGLYVEASTNTVCDVEIAGNAVVDCGGDDWGYGWGIVSGNFTRGTIRNNNVFNYGKKGKGEKTGCAISIGDFSGDISIENNRITSPRRAGILVNNTRTNAFHATVSNNSIEGAGEQGIFIYMAPGSKITGNRVKNSGRQEILLNLSGHSVAQSNSVTHASVSKYRAIEGLASPSARIDKNPGAENSSASEKK